MNSSIEKLVFKVFNENKTTVFNTSITNDNDLDDNYYFNDIYKDITFNIRTPKDIIKKENDNSKYKELYCKLPYSSRLYFNKKIQDKYNIPEHFPYMYSSDYIFSLVYKNDIDLLVKLIKNYINIEYNYKIEGLENKKKFEDLYTDIDILTNEKAELENELENALIKISNLENELENANDLITKLNKELENNND